MTNKINFRKLEDDTEHFLGIEINESKLNTLNTMQSLCREIAGLDGGIQNRFRPFSTNDKNASVSLDIESPLWTHDAAIINALSDLMGMADGFALATLENGNIRMTFNILEMWDKFGYDNDMEHGK